MSERKKRLEKKLTMKMMDDDFNERTSFFRVVSPRTSMLAPRKACAGLMVWHVCVWLQTRTAVVRTGADVTKEAVRGFLRAGDVVMGFEEEECATPNTPSLLLPWFGLELARSSCSLV